MSSLPTDIFGNVMERAPTLIRGRPVEFATGAPIPRLNFPSFITTSLSMPQNITGIGIGGLIIGGIILFLLLRK